MISYGLNLETANDYIKFFTAIIEALIVSGVITRAIWKIYKCMDTEDGLQSAFKKTKKLVFAGILAISVAEIIKLIALNYGYRLK